MVLEDVDNSVEYKQGDHIHLPEQCQGFVLLVSHYLVFPIRYYTVLGFTMITI